MASPLCIWLAVSACLQFTPISCICWCAHCASTSNPPSFPFQNSHRPPPFIYPMIDFTFACTTWPKSVFVHACLLFAFDVGLQLRARVRTCLPCWRSTRPRQLVLCSTSLMHTGGSHSHTPLLRLSQTRLLPSSTCEPQREVESGLSRR